MINWSVNPTDSIIDCMKTPRKQGIQTKHLRLAKSKAYILDNNIQILELIYPAYIFGDNNLLSNLVGHKS